MQLNEQAISKPKIGNSSATDKKQNIKEIKKRMIFYIFLGVVII